MSHPAQSERSSSSPSSCHPEGPRFHQRPEGPCAQPHNSKYLVIPNPASAVRNLLLCSQIERCNLSFVHTFVSHFGKRTGGHFAAPWSDYTKEREGSRPRGRSSP